MESFDRYVNSNEVAHSISITYNSLEDFKGERKLTVNIFKTTKLRLKFLIKRRIPSVNRTEDLR